MSNFLKGWLALTVLPLLMLLSGCNSEGAFSGTGEQDNAKVTLERIDITASPLQTRGVSELTLAGGNKLPFEAVGHYTDGSSRELTGLSVSDWHVSDPDIGFFDSPGVLIGGHTPGLVAVHVSKDGIISNTVNVNVTAAVITDINVTPATVSVAKAQT
ncbi:hypothetical protein PRZ62_21940, partial [Shewanella algae]|nr:hypothetical protein [Shewanella algae]